TLQKTLLENQAKFFNTKDDDFANYCKKCRQIIYQNKTYSRDFSWVLNVPFAYNVARYKNLSIEDLFVGKNSKQKIVAPNPHEVVANEPTQTAQQPQQNDFAQKPQTVTSDANIGTVAYMTKTESTSRGGIKGKVCGKNANISPKHLKEKRMFAERLAGKNLKVIVTRWDDNAGVYVCELAPLGPRR
ncbi:MAG: hypothetical protein IJV77_00435, partial [Clostridia bacterium]|nr:hypothetical protein [Clostridia bacterium]